MTNPKKVEAVKELTDKFSEASAIYFTNYKGMDVETTNELRSQFFENDIEYRVAKKTLTRRGAEKAGYENIDELIDGQMAIAFTYDNPVIPAKVITEFTDERDLENPSITGCIFENEFYTEERIEEIKNLPTREELIGKFANTLNAPMTKLVQALNASMSNFVNVLKSLKDKKEE